MANSKHIEILRQGAESWSRWRVASPRETPDLSQAILQGADLSDFDLSRTNLKGAYLKNASLSRAFLPGCDLSGTCLIGSNLTGANLSGAILIGAELTRTDLTEADLSEADLSEANLRYAALKDIRNWRKVWSLTLTNLYRVVDSPDGFREWAKKRGAVALPGGKWRILRDKNGRNGNGQRSTVMASNSN